MATQNPVPPTAKAPAPPTAKGFQPTPRKDAADVLKPTEAMAVPRAYLEASLPMKFIPVVNSSAALLSTKAMSPTDRKADMPKKAYKKGGTYLEKVAKPDRVDGEEEEDADVSLSPASSSSCCCAALDA